MTRPVITRSKAPAPRTPRGPLCGRHVYFIPARDNLARWDRQRIQGDYR